ncbi:hypothetical protein Tco_0930003, partial [Tanacetum coccineum]
MVACLEKSEGNADFHEIVDFLTASCLNLNDAKKIHATIDGKTVVILKSSVMRDLHFNDEDDITCLTNDAIFENLALIGMPIPNVADEAIFNEWDDRVVRATTSAASLDAARASGNITKTQSTVMSNDPLSQEIRGHTPGSDEERLEQDDLMDFIPSTPYDSPLSGGHTPRSDDGRPNNNELMAICTNLSNRVLALKQSKTAQDLVIRKLKKKVRKLEKTLRARTLVLNLFKIGTSKRKSLDKENVSKQGRKSDKIKTMFNDSDFAELDMENVEGDAETQGRNTAKHGDTFNTASIDVSVAGPSNVSNDDPSTTTAKDIFEDKMMTITDTLVVIRSTRPRTTSVVFCDVEEEPRRATPIPTVQSQDKGKGKMVEPEPT